MRVALRRPDLLPPLPYFAGLDRADLLLVADHLPLRRRSRVTRLPLESPGAWSSVPVVGGGRGRIPLAEVRISDHPPWRRAFLRSLDHRFGGTAYHEPLRDDLAAAVRDCGGLVELNLALLRVLLRALRLEIPLAPVVTEEPRHDDRPLRHALERLEARTVLLAPGDRAPAELRGLADAGRIRIEHGAWRGIGGCAGGVEAGTDTAYELVATLGPDARSVLDRASGRGPGPGTGQGEEGGPSSPGSPPPPKARSGR